MNNCKSSLQTNRESCATQKQLPFPFVD